MKYCDRLLKAKCRKHNYKAPFETKEEITNIVTKYNCLITAKHHEYINNAAFDTIEEAIGFMQIANCKYEAAHFFTIDEVEFNNGVYTFRNILKDAVYIGRTVIN